MSLSVYAVSVAPMSKMLRNLSSWLQQATTYAEERGFDVDNFTGLRLYADQFTLTQQIQSACDSAKFCAARLSGKDAPVHEDGPATVSELQERIASVLGYLEGVSEADLDGSETKDIKMGFVPEGMRLGGAEYLVGFAVPNFFFHVNQAYAILRHNGVPLGKRAYIGSLNFG